MNKGDMIRRKTSGSMTWQVVDVGTDEHDRRGALVKAATGRCHWVTKLDQFEVVNTGQSPDKMANMDRAVNVLQAVLDHEDPKTGKAGRVAEAARKVLTAWRDAR